MKPADFRKRFADRKGWLESFESYCESRGQDWLWVEKGSIPEYPDEEHLPEDETMFSVLWAVRMLPQWNRASYLDENLDELDEAIEVVLHSIWAHADNESLVTPSEAYEVATAIAEWCDLAGLSPLASPIVEAAIAVVRETAPVETWPLIFDYASCNLGRLELIIRRKQQTCDVKVDSLIGRQTVPMPLLDFAKRVLPNDPRSDAALRQWVTNNWVKKLSRVRKHGKHYIFDVQEFENKTGWLIPPDLVSQHF